PLVPGTVFLAAVTASDPQEYLFYDGVHPTSKAHELIGELAVAGVDNALQARGSEAPSAGNFTSTATATSLRQMLDLPNALQDQQAGSIGVPVNAGGTAAGSFRALAARLGEPGDAVPNHTADVAGSIQPTTRIPTVAGGNELFTWDG